MGDPEPWFPPVVPNHLSGDCISLDVTAPLRTFMGKQAPDITVLLRRLEPRTAATAQVIPVLSADRVELTLRGQRLALPHSKCPVPLPAKPSQVHGNMLIWHPTSWGATRSARGAMRASVTVCAICSGVWFRGPVMSPVVAMRPTALAMPANPSFGLTRCVRST